MQARGVALLASALVACTPAPTSSTGEAPFASGSRLRASVLDGGDGAWALLHFHDGSLDVDCDFAPTGGDAYRCLPSTGWSRFVYADAACGIALAYADGPTLPTGRFVTRPTRGPSDPAVTLGVDTATTRTVAAYYDFDLRGDCVMRPWGAVVADTFPVAYETFVAGTRHVETHGEVSAEVVVGEDGSRRVIGLVDPSRGWPCAYTWGEDLRCFPREVAWRSGTYFADAACATRVAYAWRYSEPVAVIADDVSPLAAFELGAALPVGYRSFPSCAPYDDGDHFYWEVGAPIADDALPVLAEVETGTGRLGAHYFAGSDATPLVAAWGPTFTDHVRGGDCVPVTLGGRVRCVDASTLQTSGVFADAGCTAPLLSAQSGARIQVVGDVAYAAGPVHVGTVYWHDASDACVPYAEGGATTYHEPSTTVVPNDTFAPLVTRTI